MSIIDSLKRLERSGSENSRATQKLRDAGRDVARKIEDLAADCEFKGVTLPRGYIVDGPDLMSPEVEGCSYGIFYPYRCELNPGGQKPEASREVLLQFAKDVAEGWLDELAEFLEKRAAENDAASETLEKATAKLSE